MKLRKRKTSFIGGQGMKIREVSDHYNVSLSTLRDYEKIGFFDDVERVNGVREYCDRDIERLSLILSLKKIGLIDSEILDYIHLEALGDQTKRERVNLLKTHRQQLLDQVHQKQKSIDQIDCMIYEILGCCRKDGGYER